jgi:tetratricopeptide (TPR) repeat protein
MRFSYLRHSFLVGILLSLSFLHPQPAKAFLTLPEPAASQMSPPLTSIADQTYSPELQQAIALLVQEKYAQADAALLTLIQANPTYMPPRDFYYTSQLLQKNWLTLAIENADRAYRNLPAIRFPSPRDGLEPSAIFPEQLYERTSALDWSATPDVSGAIAQVKQALNQRPDDIPLHLTLASLYILDARKYREAEAIHRMQQSHDQLRDVIRRHPQDAQLQLILANNLQPSAEKTAAYQESIRLNPQLVPAWIGFSNDGFDGTEADLPQFLSIIAAAMRANPDDFQLPYYAGETLVRFQRSEAAIDYFDTATRKLPNYRPAWRYLFLTLQQSPRDRTDEILDAIERVLQSDPTFTEVEVSAVNILMVRANRIPELVALYNRVGRLNPQLASNGLTHLGFLLTEVAPSKGDRIIRLYRRAYALVPSRDHLRQLASALIRNRQPVEGEKLLRQFLADEPSEGLLYSRGELAFAMAQQDPDRALKYLDELYAIDPQSSGYEWIGGWLAEQKRWQEATVFYERAVRQDPWYNIFLAQILAEQGQLESALVKVQTVLDSLPKENPNYYGFPSAVLCDVLAKMGRLEEAIDRYQAAVQNNQSPYTHYEFGEFLKRHQRWEAAIGQYRLAMQVAEEQQNPLLVAQSRRGIGQVLVAQGQIEAAKLELEAARSGFQDLAYIDRAAETAQELQTLLP